MKTQLVFVKVAAIVLTTVFAINNGLASAYSGSAINACIAGYPIIWNMAEFNSEMPILVIDGRTYIPLREFANEVGFYVAWNEKEKSIAIEKFEFFESQDGVLDNGIKYSYFGKDKYNYNLDTVFIQRDFVNLGNHEVFTNPVNTPQEAAEIALSVFFRNMIPSPDEWMLDIFFDYKSDFKIYYREEVVRAYKEVRKPCKYP